MQQCLFCGNVVTYIYVHGHYQCPTCFTNALPCCDGDNCHTNLLFKNDSSIEKMPNKIQNAQVSDTAGAQ